jgi:hypothetical protein
MRWDSCCWQARGSMIVRDWELWQIAERGARTGSSSTITSRDPV